MEQKCHCFIVHIENIQHQQKAYLWIQTSDILYTLIISAYLPYADK